MRAIRLAGLSSALVATTAFAGGRDDLTTFTKGLKGLDGQFTQQVFDANGKPKETSSGRVALSAPHLFRWEYNKPYEQLIVADGQRVWVYDPDLQQVTRAPRVRKSRTARSPRWSIPRSWSATTSCKTPEAKDGLAWLDVSPRKADDTRIQVRPARLRCAGPGDHAGRRRTGAEDPHRLQWLEAQSVLSGGHVPIRAGQGGRHRRRGLAPAE